MLLPLCALLLAPCPQETVGGRHEPLWATTPQPGALVNWQAVEDLTGDGVAELFTSLPFGDATIWDGQDGQPLLQLFNGNLGVPTVETADLDGDGRVELLLYQPFFSSNGIAERGRVSAYDDGTLQLLWSMSGKDTGDRLGRFSSLGDVDGDGLVDVRLTNRSRAADRVVIIGGLDGGLIWERDQLGADYARWVSDVDGDDRDDLLLGNAQQTALLSSQDGRTLWVTPYLDEDVRWDFFEVADLTGNGQKDVCLGIPRFDPGGSGGRGLIQALDGATGALLWEVRANGHFDQLGQIQVADVDGDGIAEVTSRSVQDLVQFAGPDGSVRWATRLDSAGAPTRVLMRDVDGDGVTDYVGHRSTGRGAIEVFDGRTGAWRWRYNGRTADEDFRFLVTTDLDLDGHMDFVTASPMADGLAVNGGSIRALAGTDGRVMWARGGALTDTRMGSKLMLAEMDGLPGLDILTLADHPNGSNAETGYSAMRGDTGARIWLQSTPASSVDEDWTARDLDHDGRDELIVNDRTAPDLSSVFRAYSGANGRLAWAHRIPSPGSVVCELIDTVPDIDGDGVDELRWFRERQDLSRVVETLSGADLSFVPGMQASQSELSIGAGGFVEFNLDFGAEAAGFVYQFLASSAGMGPTEASGILIPLGDGRALRRSAEGQDGGALRHEIGRLDSEGMAVVELTLLPNQLAAGAAGRTWHFAAIIAPSPAQPPVLTSAAVPILLIP